MPEGMVYVVAAYGIAAAVVAGWFWGISLRLRRVGAQERELARGGNGDA